MGRMRAYSAVNVLWHSRQEGLNAFAPLKEQLVTTDRASPDLRSGITLYLVTIISNPQNLSRVRYGSKPKLALKSQFLFKNNDRGDRFLRELRSSEW